MNAIGLVKGLTFCLLWYLSILFGFIVLYCPMIWLMLFSNYAFRLYTDTIFSFWEVYPTALLQIIFGTKIIIHGDPVDPDETSMIIMNHRTRVDWNFLWISMFHATRAPVDRKENSKFDSISNGYRNGFHIHEIKNDNRDSGVFNVLRHRWHMKFVLKDEIRHIPGPGWVMQMSCFTYIKRNWKRDEAEMYRIAKYLDDIDYTYQLLIFPEGTDLTADTMVKCNAYALKNNMMPYSQVLHPRTRGFTTLFQCLKPRMTAIYDITLAYSSFNKCNANTPIATCNLKGLLCGNFPAEVHFYIDRYSVDTLPQDEESLSKWLIQRWAEKETKLESFYDNGRFIDAKNLLKCRRKSELVVGCILWTCLVLGSVSATLLSTYFRWYLLFIFVTFITLNILNGGFHHLEMSWYEYKQRKLTKAL